MTDWINKHKWVLLLSVIVFAILIPGSIGICCVVGEIPVSMSDFYSYYGALLSFLGTVVLGFLALYQNEQLQRREERLERERKEEQEAYEKRQNQPQFHIVRKNGTSTNNMLKLSITNISNNIAKNVKLTDLSIVRGVETLWHKDINASISWSILAPTASEEFELGNDMESNPDGFDKDMLMTGTLSYMDVFDENHAMKLHGIWQQDKRILFMLKEITGGEK